MQRVLHESYTSLVTAAWDRLQCRTVALKTGSQVLRDLDNTLACRRCDPDVVQSLECDRIVCPHEIEYPPRMSHCPPRDRDPSVALRLYAEQCRAPHCYGDRDAALVMRPYFRSVHELHGLSGLEAHGDVRFENYVHLHSDSVRKVLVDLGRGVPSRAIVSRRHRKDPVYASPEAWRNGFVSSAMDAWALGIMLWQALHPGRTHPFAPPALDECSAVRTVDRALGTVEYDRTLMWAPDGAPLAADLVAALLANDPAERETVRGAMAHPLWKHTSLF